MRSEAMTRPRRTQERRSSDNEQVSSPARSTLRLLSDTDETHPKMRLDPPKAPFNSSNPFRSGSSSPVATQGSEVNTLSAGPGGSSAALIPVTPISSRDASPAPRYSRRESAGGLTHAESNVSLSVNYLPTKFSSGNLAALEEGPRRRVGRSGRERELSESGVPKMGGGVDAFRTGEARIAGHADEDEDEESDLMEDGNSRMWFGRGGGGGISKGVTRHRKPLRWNKFKWTLLVANFALTIYSFAALIGCLLTWFNTFTFSDIIRVGNRPELILSTIFACLGIFTSLVGWAGILLNNRSFLAVYTFLLWIVFIFLLVPGYMTYKRRTFNLEGKINAQWSQDLGAEGRLRIQNELQCCGYFSPFVEATVSQTCYARSILPGCKLGYLVFERGALKRWYTIAFSIVPFHLLVMVAGLLCSNHVTYRFGKGMMPKAYRLSMTSMAIIMDNYANQLAEQYGAAVASDILKRNVQLDSLPAMPNEKSPVRENPARADHELERSAKNGNSATSSGAGSGSGSGAAAGYTYPSTAANTTKTTSGKGSLKYEPLSTRVPSNERVNASPAVQGKEGWF
ncbi:unnamed protein product [Cyclocybe aegerita]|uniref:Tetraspanin Tsp2 n=1 Tax=Cyclocybe aegerita TaxID=1973307 RepID=A0A8S0W3P6_CYCAE|nr:unnamed protein product [Cyclocybe aegerita]